MGGEATSRARTALLALLLANLAVKLGAAFAPLNAGEYTDGILQLKVFENRAGLYPPLYGVLARCVPHDLELGGRIVSALSSSLVVLPVALLAKEATAGEPAAAREKAALWAVAAVTVCPLVVRWAPRVMTDSLFLLLTAAVLAAVLGGWNRLREGAAAAQAGAAKWFGAAGALVGAAALARYQGVFLAPLAGLALVGAWRAGSPRGAVLRAGAAVVAGGLPGAAIVLWWMRVGGFTHGGQFSERAVGQWWQQALAWWNTAESFTLLLPYSIGYPMAAAAGAGIVSTLIMRGTGAGGGGGAGRRALALFGGWFGILLALQAAFGSFQFRYMLPLAPGIAVLAGLGIARWLAGPGRWRHAVAGAGVAAQIIISVLTAWLGRDAMGDQRRAAERAALLIERQPSAAIFSNEQYGTFSQVGCPKMSFWSGRPVQPLLAALAATPPGAAAAPLAPGSLVLLSTAYGGPERVAELLQELQQRGVRLAPAVGAPVRGRVWPLQEEVMVNPLFNQNPMGWVMRYVPQDFATMIYRVEAPRP